MAKVASALQLLGVPVVGQLDERVLVARRREKEQREAARLDFVTPDLDEPELAAVKVERSVQVRHADHGVEVLHRASIPDVDPLRTLADAQSGLMRRASM